MDELTLFNLVLSIEKNENVNELIIEGVEIWPLVRIALRDAYIDQLEKRDSIVTSKSKFKDISTKAKSYIQSQLVLSRIGRTHALIVTKQDYLTDKIDNQDYDRHAYPLHEYITAHYDSMVNVLSEDTLSTQPSKNTFIDAHKLHFSIFRNKKLGLKMHQDYRKLLDNWLLLSKIERLSKLKVKNRLLELITYILSSRSKLKTFLADRGVKKLFLICYYSRTPLALICAAKDLNITTIDIQHGKQGSHHLGYCGWTQIPIKGYHMLPNYFWNWGEIFQKEILKKRNNKNHHIPVPIGNLWLNRWKGEQYDHESQLSALIKRNKIVICFSLQQAIEYPIPEFILKIMKRVDLNIFWLLRLHPNQTRGNTKVLELLKDISPNNYEIELSSKLPLYEILNESSLHVTNWSSVCVEALHFNVQTIIIHENGKEFFKNEIAKNQFLYANSERTFLTHVNTIINTHRNQLVNGYFQSDKALQKKLIDQFLLF